jgi:hypothetical protein
MKSNTAILIASLLAGVPAAAQTPPAAPAPSSTPARTAAPQPAPAPARTPSAAPAAKPQTAPPQPAARPGEIETAPIRCWWRTDRAEIRIGERFAVTLTCGVIETRALKVVAGTNQLDPGAVQLTPFEVVAGTRREDIVAPPWRYFQFDYSVRLLSEGFFGQDIAIPSLNVTYNIQAAAGNGAQGRDQTYVLPPLPVRVAMLVPKDASDIRDSSNDGFAAIATRRARATNATVAGGILFAVAAVLLLFGAVRALGGFKQRKPGSMKPISPVMVLHGCLRELGRVKSDVTRDGWSPALARRALAPLRAAGTVGLGRQLAQEPVASTTNERDGQLKLRYGVLRPRWTVVSGAVTPQTVDRALAVRSSGLSARARAALERIRGGLQTFGPAGYGRGGELDTIALDAALSEATDAVRELRWRSAWPAMGAGGTRPATAGLRTPSMSGERL